MDILINNSVNKHIILYIIQIQRILQSQQITIKTMNIYQWIKHYHIFKDTAFLWSTCSKKFPSKICLVKLQQQQQHTLFFFFLCFLLYMFILTHYKYSRLFVTEIVHLKHLYHKLQRKKRKLENKNKKRNRLTVSTNQSRRRSDDDDEIKYNNDESSETGGGGGGKSFTIHSPRQFTLSVTGYEYETDIDSGDDENCDSPSNVIVLQQQDDDDHASFFDTRSTRNITTNTARSRDTETHEKNDWKTIKRKYVLNPQDDHLPFISKSIYKSSIMKENDFHNKIKMILEKYIINGALYEINIKYNRRKKLLSIYNEKYKNYVSKQELLSNLSSSSTEPSTPNSPSLSGNTPKSIMMMNGISASNLPSISENISEKTDTTQKKLTDEQYVTLNNSIIISDVEIFDKAVQSIMGLLKSSYVEFCKTKEYIAFSKAYNHHEKLDIFNALRGETNVCRCFCL